MMSTCPPPSFGHLEFGATASEFTTAWTLSTGIIIMDEITDLEISFCSRIPLIKVFTRGSG